MSRNVLTTITADDYKDLKQTYSDKNIINQTSGVEYVINAASSTTLEDIRGGSTDVNITPLNGGRSARWWAYIEGQARGLIAHQDIQSRDEYYITSGSFSIETDEIISDVNSVSLALKIYYDKYKREHDYVSSGNIKGNTAVYYDLMNNAYKQNDEYLVADAKMPYESGNVRIAVFDLFGLRGSLSWKNEKCSSTFPSNSFYTRCKKLSNDHYQITVYYSIVTWWGKQDVEAGKWSQSNNATLLVARKLGFTIKANTVDASEVEFNYTRSDDLNGNAKGKNYEMESNEFLQTDEKTSSGSRQSSILSQEIFNKFATDRTIVTFTLLNCEKYLVNDEYRYLRAEDLIYIKDENDEYISDDLNASGEQIPCIFQVLKTRPIWNGSFEMEVTCRKIDMT